jgi:hypothetical protein
MSNARQPGEELDPMGVSGQGMAVNSDGMRHDFGPSREYYSDKTVSW